MGTRNLTLVQSDGEYKVAQYGQWDGYPEGAGLGILGFLRQMELPAFQRRVDSLQPRDAMYIQRLWKELGADDSGMVSLGLSDSFKANYPQFHRDTGWRILPMIYHGKTNEVFLKLEFAADSLFCEWAYVIDLDRKTFEVYEGFNRRPLEADARFAGMTPPLPRGETTQYYPVSLRAQWPLNALPSQGEFLDTFDRDKE